MKYDFDEIIERNGTGCVKYDKAPKGLIPLWVADMDFRTPDFITDALHLRLDKPVLGYPFIPKDYFPTIARWVRNLHGWDVRPEWFCYVPGIVKGISLAELSLLSKGSGVIIQPPIYHPFRIVTEKNGMEVIYNPLKPVCDGDAIVTYEMDFDGLERCIDKGARMLLLSNPQNPSGICWSRETLERLAEITSRRGVLVISDEIHGEMAHRGSRHVPYASVSEAAAKNSITFMAPSKTFNIAGVVSSYAIIPNETLRKEFFAFMDATELDYPSIFSIEATMAAYRKGASWRRQMLRYIEGNISYVEGYLAHFIPRIKAMHPQASFLIWLDCRALGMTQKQLMLFLKRKAGLYLNDGTMFGPEGEGFVRLNVGCPRSVLRKALDQLAAAVNSL